MEAGDSVSKRPGGLSDLGNIKSDGNVVSGPKQNEIPQTCISDDRLECSTNGSSRFDKIQQIVESATSDESKRRVSGILEQVDQLTAAEKLLLYLKLPSGRAGAVDPLRQPLNPLGSRLEVQQTITWIKTHLHHDPEVSLPKQDVYQEYLTYCSTNNMKPLSTADFGKVMKQVFPWVRPRRLGTRGHSRYCYAGMRKRLRLNPPSLPDLGDIEKEDDCEGSEGCGETVSAASHLIREWAEKLLGVHFSSLKELACYLIDKMCVDSLSVASFTLLSSANGLATDKGSVVLPSGGRHREAQLQLQRKLVERNVIKEQKRRLQDQQTSPMKSSKRSRVLDSVRSRRASAPEGGVSRETEGMSVHVSEEVVGKSELENSVLLKRKHNSGPCSVNIENPSVSSFQYNNGPIMNGTPETSSSIMQQPNMEVEHNSSTFSSTNHIKRSLVACNDIRVLTTSPSTAPLVSSPVVSDLSKANACNEMPVSGSSNKCTFSPVHEVNSIPLGTVLTSSSSPPTSVHSTNGASVSSKLPIPRLNSGKVPWNSVNNIIIVSPVTASAAVSKPSKPKQKYKPIQPKPAAAIRAGALSEESLTLPHTLASSSATSVQKVSSPTCAHHSDWSEISLSPQASTSGAGGVNITSLEKDALDEYFHNSNSQEPEEELMRYFQEQPSQPSSASSTPLQSSVPSDNKGGKLSQLRMLLERNINSVDKQIVPAPKTTPVSVPSASTLSLLLSGSKPTSTRRRVSFETPSSADLQDSPAVPPSPNTRRRVFNFTPISEAGTPHSVPSSPFVSPRNTPVPRSRHNSGQTFASPRGTPVLFMKPRNSAICGNNSTGPIVRGTRSRHSSGNPTGTNSGIPNQFDPPQSSSVCFDVAAALQDSGSAQHTTVSVSAPPSPVTPQTSECVSSTRILQAMLQLQSIPAAASSVPLDIRKRHMSGGPFSATVHHRPPAPFPLSPGFLGTPLFSSQAHEITKLLQNSPGVSAVRSLTRSQSVPLHQMLGDVGNSSCNIQYPVSYPSTPLFPPNSQSLSAFTFPSSTTNSVAPTPVPSEYVDFDDYVGDNLASDLAQQTLSEMLSSVYSSENQVNGTQTVTDETPKNGGECPQPSPSDLPTTSSQLTLNALNANLDNTLQPIGTSLNQPQSDLALMAPLSDDLADTFEDLASDSSFNQLMQEVDFSI